MIIKLLIAWGLMATCVTVHAVGLTAMSRLIKRLPALADLRFWIQTWILIRIAGALIFLHLVEIFVWAMLYFWSQSVTDLHSAFYFSSVTYTTVGYGDIVLSREWRLVGGIEALTGILMCGWSTAFFFLIISRIYVAQTKQERP
jgi:hypothetical protein